MVDSDEIGNALVWSIVLGSAPVTWVATGSIALSIIVPPTVLIHLVAVIVAVGGE